jgi:glycosyltransferase involved in cell wall biosynthesis
MCVYNGAACLPEQLQSLAAQTRLPDELIVGDDGSTDATVDIVEAFAARASFPVRLHVNERHLGTTGNFERAIGRCTGDVIALADQDDVWRPGKLERLTAVLAASPAIALVFSDAELVDAESRPLGRRLWEVFGGNRARRRLRSREGALRLLLPGWTVTGATMAFRAALRPLALPIPTEIPMGHDGWIALVASVVARVHFIEEPLMLYRQHAAQQVGTRWKRNAPSSLRIGLRRVTSYADALATIAEVRRRLQAGAVVADPAVLRELTASAAHFGVRSALPSRWPRRVPLVWRELRSRRYHRYGRGFKSAAKDLLIGPSR